MSETVPGHADLVERLAVIARAHLEIDGDDEGSYIRLDSVENAVLAILADLSTPIAAHGDGAVTEAMVRPLKMEPFVYVVFGEAEGEPLEIRGLIVKTPEDAERTVRNLLMYRRGCTKAWFEPLYLRSPAALRPDEAADACPVCGVSFKPFDICAMDIELGTCHASCLKGSPTVDLDSGEPVDGPIPTYPYSGDAVASCTDHSGGIVTNSSAGHESEASPRISAPDEAAGQEEASKPTVLADWNNLPKDIYVIEAKSHGGIAFDVTCCSVPMMTAPEVRYTRADLLATPLPEASDAPDIVPVAWRYHWKNGAGEWSDWMTCPIDPNDWTWPPSWADMEAQPLFGPDALAALRAELAAVTLERDTWQEELGRVIMACPMSPEFRTSPTSKGVRNLRTAYEATEAEVARLKDENKELVAGLEAAVDAAFPGDEAIYDDAHESPQAMIEAAITAYLASLPQSQDIRALVDTLAQEIRRVDGDHSLGAGALAEALMPFIAASLSCLAGEGWRPKVKPLVWKEEPVPPAGEWLASSSIGLYCIPLNTGAAYLLRFRDADTLGFFDTIEAAKAAAQADYDRRILSALDLPAPSVEEKLP